MYKNFFKRIIDFTAAFIGLICFLPIMLPIGFLLLIVNNGKPFFFQKRPGKGERIFSIIKFKTMTDKKNSEGELLPDVERLTKIGQFVRKTSLDEIPQLFNVLLGQMSLVGPRPLLPRYLPRYSVSQRRRHDVKPGITGWAQVNGRNAIGWQKKFELDVYYVDNISFMLDVRILIKTVVKVIKSDGISADNHATMQEFMGN